MKLFKIMAKLLVPVKGSTFSFGGIYLIGTMGYPGRALTKLMPSFSDLGTKPIRRQGALASNTRWSTGWSNVYSYAAAALSETKM